jgi:hypothetical protein
VHFSHKQTYLYRFFRNFNFLPWFWLLQKWSVYGPTALAPELCTVQYHIYIQIYQCLIFPCQAKGQRVRAGARTWASSFLLSWTVPMMRLRYWLWLRPPIKWKNVRILQKSYKYMPEWSFFWIKHFKNWLFSSKTILRQRSRLIFSTGAGAWQKPEPELLQNTVYAFLSFPCQRIGLNWKQ